MKIRAAFLLQNCKDTWAALALSVLFGTSLGILVAITAGDKYFLLMRMAIRRPVSIVGSAVAVVIPFLVSFYLVNHSRPWLVYLVCAVRLCTFASVASAISFTFGNSGWIVRLLLQFPDLCLIPMLLYMSCHSLMGHMSRGHQITCIAYSIAIGMINYFMISPFLAGIIDSYETMGRYAIHVGLDWRL